MKPSLTILALGAALTAFAQQRGAQQYWEPPSSLKNEIEVVPVRGNVYLFSGAGANIVASVGPEGVLVVDSGRAEMSDKVLAAIQRLNRELSVGGKPIVSSKPVKPIRYIVNTSPLPEH